MRIPIIEDINLISDNDLEQISAIGVGYVRIPNLESIKTHITALEKCALSFYRQPLEEKNKYAVDMKRFEGYLDRTRKDPPQLNEQMFFRPHSPLGPFKDVADEIERVFTVFYYQVGAVLIKKILNHYALSEHGSSITESILPSISFPYYPKPDDEKEVPDIGLRPHTDTELINLLYTNESGLEIFVENFWIPVEPKPGFLIVNISETMALMTGGRCHPSHHRVRVPTKERLTIAVFASPKMDDPIMDLTTRKRLFNNYSDFFVSKMEQSLLKNSALKCPSETFLSIMSPSSNLTSSALPRYLSNPNEPLIPSPPVGTLPDNYSAWNINLPQAIQYRNIQKIVHSLPILRATIDDLHDKDLVIAYLTLTALYAAYFFWHIVEDGEPLLTRCDVPPAIIIPLEDILKRLQTRKYIPDPVLNYQNAKEGLGIMQCGFETAITVSGSHVEKIANFVTGYGVAHASRDVISSIAKAQTAMLNNNYIKLSRSLKRLSTAINEVCKVIKLINPRNVDTVEWKLMFILGQSNHIYGLGKHDDTGGFNNDTSDLPIFFLIDTFLGAENDSKLGQHSRLRAHLRPKILIEYMHTIEHGPKLLDYMIPSTERNLLITLDTFAKTYEKLIQQAHSRLVIPYVAANLVFDGIQYLLDRLSSSHQQRHLDKLLLASSDLPESKDEELSELEIYTMDTLLKFIVRGHTLLKINNKIYDVSEFINQHPGGKRILQIFNGIDASSVFTTAHHNLVTTRSMGQYLLGRYNEPNLEGRHLEISQKLNVLTKRMLILRNFILSHDDTLDAKNAMYIWQTYLADIADRLKDTLTALCDLEIVVKGNIYENYRKDPYDQLAMKFANKMKAIASYVFFCFDAYADTTSKDEVMLNAIILYRKIFDVILQMCNNSVNDIGQLFHCVNNDEFDPSIMSNHCDGIKNIIAEGIYCLTTTTMADIRKTLELSERKKLSYCKKFLTPASFCAFLYLLKRNFSIFDDPYNLLLTLLFAHVIQTLFNGYRFGAFTCRATTTPTLFKVPEPRNAISIFNKEQEERGDNDLSSSR